MVVARRALMGSVGCGAYVSLFAQRMAFGAFYTAGETPTRSQGTELATSQLRRLEMAAGD